MDFDGGTANFVYLKYTRDRNGNPTLVTDSTDRDFRSAKHTFDNLNRLASSDVGTVAGSAVEGTKSGVDYAMDILGNFGGPSGTTNGININKQIGSDKAIKHIINATNEITSLEHPETRDETRDSHLLC